MGCGMSKYGLVDVGTCGFLSKRNFEALHMDGTASTKLLIKDDVEYDDIDFNHSCNSLSSPTNNANITVKETTTTTGGNNSSMNKFGEGEKETEVDQDEKGGNKNNKEEIKEEEEDERGRKISDFDGSLIGSPSFREYCTNVAKDDFKDDGNSDGEEKETKVKGSHCNASPKSYEGLMTNSTKIESKGRRFRKVFPIGRPSAMKKLLISASRGRHGKSVEQTI
ncbi:unnamed protein product [Camellia sinensis]